MHLKQEVIERWISKLRESFPQLDRFDRPDTVFDTAEIGYKLEFSERLEQAFKANDDKHAYVDAFLDAAGRPMSGQSYNLIDWRALDQIRNHPAKAEMSVCLQRFIDQTADGIIGDDVFATLINGFAKAWDLDVNGSFDAGRQLVEAVAMHLFPEDAIYFRRTVLDKFYQEATGQSFPQLKDAGAEYLEELRFGRAVKAEFEALGMAPRNLLDVQSALWVVHSSKEVGPRGAKWPHQDLKNAMKMLEAEHVHAAMDKCQNLGLDAFLTIGKFGRPQTDWAERPDDLTHYPAKASIANSLGIVADRSPPDRSEFFDGFGEKEAREKLRELGFKVIDKSNLNEPDAMVPRHSRNAIEAAMDAFDEYKRTKLHAGIFDNFGTPKDYWVRSTKAERSNRVFPSKQIVGYLLKKDGLNGGWNQNSAATQLHNSGYVIVNKEDQPVESPSDKAYLLEGMERIHLHAFNYHVAPAIDAGRADVSIKSGDILEEIGNGVRTRNICTALNSTEFSNFAGLSKPVHSDKFPSRSTVFTYDLLGRPPEDLINGIKNNDTKNAFLLLWRYCQRPDTRYRIEATVKNSGENGKISVKFFWKGSDDWHPFSAIINQQSLLFYIRRRAYPIFSFEHIRDVFVECVSKNKSSDREMTVTLKDRNDVEKAISNIFEKFNNAMTEEQNNVWKGSGSVSDLNSEENATLVPSATNLILYGPPGTGKTYQTTWEAVRLCVGDEAADELKDDRNAIVAEYHRLVDEGRIAFTTFHQSMSYEEFVEGLRPNAADAAAGFSLNTEPGLFQQISSRAEKNVLIDRHLEDASGEFSLEGRNIHKLSLGQAGTMGGEEIFEEAIGNSIALFGFPDHDWSADEYDSVDAIRQWCETTEQEIWATPSAVATMTNHFRNTLAIGDVLVISKGNSKFRAIGIVKGQYEYVRREGGHYSHRRSVDWIWVDREGLPVDQIYSVGFIQKTIYSLKEEQLNRDVLLLVATSAKPDRDRLEVSGKTQPYVLIIDEINRANISKVFGELITLLEQDKRLGATNEIRVQLPYSKKYFGVPQNLNVIGTMNTADRSIALLDTALRRRFTFKELMPDPEILSANMDGINLQKLLRSINDRIEYLFDREHQIGHAYFTGCRNRADVENVIRDKVIPLLTEYFYDDWFKVALVLGDTDQSGCFLMAEKLSPPTGFPEDDYGSEKLRWRVKDSFDFTKFET